MNPTIVDGSLIVKLLEIIDPRGKRDVAIERLLQMLPYLDLSIPHVAVKLYQVLPHFFAHFYLLEERETIVKLIKKVIAVERNDFRIHLLLKWFRFVLKQKFTTHSQIANKDTHVKELAQVLGYEDLEFFIHVCRWLKSERKLHKYIYFFSNLTYLEFLSITDENILLLDSKVDLLPITKGARGAITNMMADMDRRVNLLRKYAMGSHFEDFEAFYKDFVKVLKTPIRRSDLSICAKEEEISFLLVACLRKACSTSNGFENAEWMEKVGSLMQRVTSMRYVFNDRQMKSLTDLKWNLHQRYSSCNGNSNNRSDDELKNDHVSAEPIVQPMVINVPRLFDDEEIHNGFMRTVIFLERLLTDA